MGSHGYKRLRWWKSVFIALLVGFGIFDNIYAEEIGPWCHEGPTMVGVRPLSSWMPRGFPDLYSKSSGCLLVQEDSSRKFHPIWIPFGIPFLRNPKTREKTGTGTGLSVNRLVPKII